VVSTLYFSFGESSQQFLRCIRQQHWQIEHSSQRVLDIAFCENESRIRKDHTPQDMAILRQMATNLLKQETSKKISIAAKRKMAGWNNDYGFKVLRP
jgi:predicted transposase YbfD/YdcC